MSWNFPGPPDSLRIERAAREEIQQLQDEHLRGLVARAWEHIPFYRQRWEVAGVRPGDIKGTADIQKLPIIRKSDFEVS